MTIDELKIYTDKLTELKNIIHSRSQQRDELLNKREKIYDEVFERFKNYKVKIKCLFFFNCMVNIKICFDDIFYIHKLSYDDFYYIDEHTRRDFTRKYLDSYNIQYSNNKKLLDEYNLVNDEYDFINEIIFDINSCFAENRKLRKSEAKYLGKLFEKYNIKIEN